MSTSSSQQQQQQVDEEAVLFTVKALEEAVSLLFESNFDVDSSVCLVTLLKILDNILHKPGDMKVRQLRMQNPTVWQKIGQRKGGIEILQACGFQQQILPPPLLSGNRSSISSTIIGDDDEMKDARERILVLSPEREQQSILITARRLLQTRAIQDLKMDPNVLPPYRPPPQPIHNPMNTNHHILNDNNNTRTLTGNNFNIYSGHRYDAQSAAVGTNLGPSANYKSKTEVELKLLQQQQEQLEQKLHQQQTLERQWQAFAPAASSSTMTTIATNGNGSGGSSSSDSSLIMARMQKQQMERTQRDGEKNGFTTMAMRELERMKKEKVYSHVTLTIQFPSGHSIRGQFLPKETIQTVIETLQTDCLIPDVVVVMQQRNNNNNKEQQTPPTTTTMAKRNTNNKKKTTTTTDPSHCLELYVTPPRRLLDFNQTLQQEGLVPAAKVFVSWKPGCAPVAESSFLQPRWFVTSSSSSSSIMATSSTTTTASAAAAAAAAKTSLLLYPTSQNVADAAIQQQQEEEERDAAAAATTTINATTKKKKKKTKGDREEEMLKRMMMGGGGGGIM